MKTVREMVAEYLKKIGADGLCDPKKECGCGIDELFVCGEDPASCVPAVFVRCRDCLHVPNCVYAYANVNEGCYQPLLPGRDTRAAVPLPPDKG